MTNKKHLEPSYFFSKWEDPKIRKLFSGAEYAWEPLKKMYTFLGQIPTSPPRNNVSIGEYCSIGDNVIIGEGAVIRAHSYIQGPTYMGKNCKIGPFAYIRKSIIDDGVDWGTTELKGSIIGSGTTSLHKGYVGDSILGRGVNIGAGFTTANLRFDEKEVCVESNPTGATHFGAIIGDHSKMGVQSMTMPGTLMGKNVWLYPNIKAKGFVKSNTKVKE